MESWVSIKCIVQNILFLTLFSIFKESTKRGKLIIVFDLFHVFLTWTLGAWRTYKTIHWTVWTRFSLYIYYSLYLISFLIFSDNYWYSSQWCKRSECELFWLHIEFPSTRRHCSSSISWYAYKSNVLDMMNQVDI